MEIELKKATPAISFAQKIADRNRKSNDAAALASHPESNRLSETLSKKDSDHQPQAPDNTVCIEGALKFKSKTPTPAESSRTKQNREMQKT